jgi:DNA sulfur modification protein DndB
MSGIIGDLCSNEKDLKRAASKRRKDYFEESVPHDQVETYERDGWRAIRKNKKKTKMRKSKSPDVSFEDQVWMVFYNLGFSYMNKERKCKFKFNSYTKQIDVLARDEGNIFVVECKSSESGGVINAKGVLEEYVGKREDIQKALQSEWGRGCGRINLVVVISSLDKRKEDEDYVKEKRDSNIFLWSRKEMGYLENLIRQVGSTAKYQLYAVIFGGKKQKSLKKDYLSLRCKIGGSTCYSFLMPAKELLSYAYVHHRKLTGISEASQAYQRMLNSAKLKEIANFVDNEEGFFPNSIIVNFTERLHWNHKLSKGDVAIGTVTLPEYYGCAWIIDGQHRLYGVASAKKDITVPILAFECIDQKDQANLFVDINEKQKKVPPDLLWDLYSDIYRGSPDDRQKLLFQIAETAKKLDDSGPLHGFIDIPSIPKERSTKLSLTTVCSTLQKYSPWDHLKHPASEAKTPEHAARIINSYFEVLKLLWPEDWAKGNDGVLLTNNGFGVFMMLFQDIVKHILYKQRESLLREHKKTEFEELLKSTYLTPVIEYLKTDKPMQDSIRKEGGRGPQSGNAAILDIKIQDFIPDYSPVRMGGEVTISPPEKPPAVSSIEEKARRAEGHLRTFILEKLKSFYGSDKWWKQGLTVGAKKEGDEKWRDEVSDKPYLRKETNQNERKFEFLGLGHMIEIVCYGDNWKQIFEPVFNDKNNFQRRITDVKKLRDPCSHSRRPDDQDVVDGTSGLLWLSNCMGISELHPYS